MEFRLTRGLRRLQYRRQVDRQGQAALRSLAVASRRSLAAAAQRADAVRSALTRGARARAQGMDFTTDKLRSMVRKWQTLIEAHVDVKTTDGYLLRMFCIAFTKKRQQQVKKTCYAQTSQIRQIRRKMVELMTREAAACDLKELVGKFIPEAIGAAPAARRAAAAPRALRRARKLSEVWLPAVRQTWVLVVLKARGSGCMPWRRSGRRIAQPRSPGARCTGWHAGAAC